MKNLIDAVLRIFYDDRSKVAELLENDPQNWFVEGGWLTHGPTKVSIWINDELRNIQINSSPYGNAQHQWTPKHLEQRMIIIACRKWLDDCNQQQYEINKKAVNKTIKTYLNKMDEE